MAAVMRTTRAVRARRSGRAAPKTPGAVRPQMMRGTTAATTQLSMTKRVSSSNRASTISSRAVPEIAGAVQEVAQLAAYEDEIFRTAGIVFGMTLLGLSLGFVLLKVESLVEEDA